TPGVLPHLGSPVRTSSRDPDISLEDREYLIPATLEVPAKPPESDGFSHELREFTLENLPHRHVRGRLRDVGGDRRSRAASRRRRWRATRGGGGRGAEG